MFLPLQGLGEGERYALLSGVVSGEIALKDIKAMASTKKLLQGVKAELVQQLKVNSWEEAVKDYPLHTTEDVLKPYRGNYS